MFSKTLILCAIAAVAVHAQAPPSGTAAGPAGPVPSVPPCVLTCTQQAATANGCAGITDINCVCTNQKFQADSGQCLQQKCVAADQQAAAALQTQLCASAPGAPGAPGSPKPSGPASAPASSAAPAATSSAASAAAPSSAASSAAPVASAPAASSAPASTASAAKPNSAVTLSFSTAQAVGVVSAALAMIAGGAALF